VATRTEYVTAGGPAVPAGPSAVSRVRTARRILADRWASRGVVLGGVTVIASILAILVVIVAEVYPLFRPATATPVEVRRSSGAVGLVPGAPLGVDEYREIAYQVTAAGLVELLALRSDSLLAPVPIPGLGGASVTAVAATANGSRYLLGTSDGRVIPFAMTFEIAYPGGTRTVTPSPEFGTPARLDPGHPRPLQRLAFAEPADGPRIAGQVGPRDLAILTATERRSLVGETTREESRERLLLEAVGEITALALDQRGDNLFVGTSRGELVRYDIRDPAAPRRAELLAATTVPEAPVTALGLLIGDRTLVVGDQVGGVTSWQVVAPPTGGPARLARVHTFAPHEHPVVAISASRRDKGFVTADASGDVRLRYGTTGTTLLALAARGAGLQAVAMAPKADGLLALGADGELSEWHIHNPHPEITLRALFGKVWYEGYSAPAHVWQSTGGTDDFEAKFSLTPLIFGTIKGTLYALLFAVPLALLAALYVSEFMDPTLRAYLKPVVEIMAAMPSVVLGFLAGLWLAPIVERVVPGLFVAPLVVPACILVALVLWRRLPGGIRRRLRPGTELVLLVPVVAAGLWLAFGLGGVLERSLLGGDYRGWLLSALGLTYDQRNSLVVGIAMGFAVIPIIFTIAEDSLSNVPPHLRAGSLALGATRWQTAVRIVLPTASPGIFSAIMIGFGRAVGETMIVLMATGNTPVLDWSIFNGFRALSANIAVELPEAPEGGSLFRVLFLAAFLLFCLTFLVNTAAEMVRLRLRRRYRYL
jgi:phosphate transport system permease protein